MVEYPEYSPPERIVLVVGNYGSGKTEVSVNLAIHLARSRRVAVADLDLVNPYFRCREARAELERHAIRVINPEGDLVAADLPIVLPEIRGAVRAGGGEVVILDVGGDDVGARVLSSLADIFAGIRYSMLQVLNAKRPFTGDVAGCLKIKREIEAASRLAVTALVSNTHLMEETSPEIIVEGLELARAAGRAAAVPVAFVTADEKLRPMLDAREQQDPRIGGCPVLWLDRRMLPPWKLKSMTDRAERVLKRKA